MAQVRDSVDRRLSDLVAGRPATRARERGSRDAERLQFQSDDLDEVREFVGLHFGDHSRVAKRRGPLGFWLSGLRTGTVGIGRGGQALPAVVRAAVSAPTFHLPLRGIYSYLIGRRTIEARAGQVVFLPRDHEYTMLSPAGAALSIQLATEPPESWPAASAPASVLDYLHADIVRVGRDDHRRLVRAAEAALSSSADDELGRAQVCAIAHRWLDAMTGMQRTPTADRRLATRHIEAVARDWIEQHLHERIDLRRIAEALGCHPRQLQRVFRARYGRSPMDFLAERRLAAVHRRLAEHRPNDSVTRAALDLGITHLGRFAASYSRIFGEHPSATIRQRVPRLS